MFYETNEQGVILRVRLTPNSSACSVRDVFTDAAGQDFLKINVISVPEKGKANQELVAFLAKKLKLPKSCLKIVSGETDRDKKIFLADKSDKLLQILQSWGAKE